MSQTKKRKAKSPTPPVDPPVGPSISATTPGGSRVGITTEDVLRNTGAFLEILKNVSDASQIVGPLEAVCRVLKITADTVIVHGYI